MIRSLLRIDNIYHHSALKSRFKLLVRNFLSSAYGCQTEWERRFEQPLINNINPSQFVYEIEKKFRTEGKISAIDADLFLNSLNVNNAKTLIGEVDGILAHLRRSPETIHTLPSTRHAALRLLLDMNDSERLMKYISLPLNYGIFPEYYEANMLMDGFIKNNDFMAAARIAVYMMLQEDFGPYLSQLLSLFSCYKYVFSEDHKPWVDYTPRKEEPVEEVHVRVNYLRNPYFDDHFDIKDSNLLVGKTLACVSPLIKSSFASSCEILGWSLYEKWDKTIIKLQNALDVKVKLDDIVVAKIKFHLQSNEENQDINKIMSLLQEIENTSLTTDLKISESLTEMIVSEVKEAEEKDVSAQIKNYKLWEELRNERFEKQLKEYEKKMLVKEIEEKKKALQEKEDVLYFFDNQEKLELLIAEKAEKIKELNRRQEVHKTSTDEDYVPPEVQKRHEPT